MRENKPISCHLCKRELTKIAVGLNKKLLGRNIIFFFCMDCLAEYLDTTTDILLEKAEDFKAQGCTLFI
jgi:hypothetical protein